MMPLHTHILPPPPTHILSDASLFLDFDGTLVEIAARPDAVQVEQGLHGLVMRLYARLGGRLAIVSGRAAANVRALFPEQFLMIAGSHGAELCHRESRDTAVPRLELDAEIRARLEDLRAAHPGVLIEYKPFGLALHYRQAAEADTACRRLAGELAVRTGLVLQPGKMVIELKTPGHDKGTALRTLMQRQPWREGRPLFIGDDDTDEAAFRAAASLGGAGILVGDARPSAAAFRLHDVSHTLRWLEGAVAA